MDEVKLGAEVPAADTPDAASLAPFAGGDPAHEVSAQAWKKARELALRQLDLLVSLEPRALSGDDPDAVHDLRVASRRLQQVLDLLHPAPQHGEVRRLRRKVRRCRRALGEVRNCAAPAVHRVRLAGKRFRYLIEVVNAFGVPGSVETLGWLRRLQRRLGNWHDVEVLEQMMIEMVGRPEFLRDHLELAMSVEKLIIRNRAAKKKFEEEYFGMTQSSAGLERLRGWVSYVLASPSAAFATA